MSCDKFQKYISLHVDGTLDAGGERALKEHLSGCPRCRETLAALQSVEKTAKTARAKEPRAGYWDTFSGRVMRRIESEEARRGDSWWTKWAPVTLPPPGKRMRFAAGLATIAVAVVVGAFFVSRQGDRIVPTVAQLSVEQKAPDEKETPAEKGKDMLAEGRNALGEETATPAEKKATPPPVAKREASPPAAKKEDASSAAKTEAPPMDTKTEKAREAAPSQVAETPKPTVPVEAAEKEALDAAASSDAPKEEKLSAPAPEKLAQPKAVSFTTADKRGRSAALRGSRAVGGVTLQNIADSDTTLTVEGLRAHITGWEGLIASSPADSVTNEGYREVAYAYCLLAEQTRADADIEEGARVIRTYLDRSKDPELKTYLAARLEEIQGLKKK